MAAILILIELFSIKWVNLTLLNPNVIHLVKFNGICKENSHIPAQEWEILRVLYRSTDKVAFALN